MTYRRTGRRAAFALAGLIALALLVALDGGRAVARGVAGAEGARAQVRAKQSGGIVASIVKSPVSPDGNVAGAPTDLVVNLDVSMDPADFGVTFSPGDIVRVRLPAGFVDTGALTFAPSGPNCYVAGTAVCNGIVMLQGWPQYPVVPFGGYTPSFDVATGTISMPITSVLSSVPTGYTYVGVKQIHLLLPGFVNPTRPGKYRIDVIVERAGGAIERGWANADIRPHVEPSIHVTSVFQDGGPITDVGQRRNPLYQSTADGLRPVTLLLWDDHGAPFVGVTLEADAGAGYRLMQGGHTVGQVRVDGPKHGDLTVAAAGPSFAFNAPITGIATARAIVEFVPGSVPGDYMITFSLNGGNDVTFVITAS